MRASVISPELTHGISPSQNSLRFLLGVPPERNFAQRLRVFRSQPIAFIGSPQNSPASSPLVPPPPTPLSFHPLQQPGDLGRTRQLAPQFLGQALDEAIGRYTDGLTGVAQGVFDDGASFFLAENDADRGILSGLADG